MYLFQIVVILLYYLRDQKREGDLVYEANIIVDVSASFTVWRVCCARKVLTEYIYSHYIFNRYQYYFYYMVFACLSFADPKSLQSGEECKTFGRYVWLPSLFFQ